MKQKLFTFAMGFALAVAVTVAYNREPLKVHATLLPSISAGCGSGASITGVDNGFILTGGATNGDSTCEVTFGTVKPTRPACSVIADTANMGDQFNLTTATDKVTITTFTQYYQGQTMYVTCNDTF